MSYEDVVGELLNMQVPRFYTNLDRVNELARHSRFLLEKNDADADFLASDILRAAVVLTHSTMEDFLRSVASALLPYRDEQILNHFHEKKFSLGQLAAHREESVHEFIQGIVAERLSRKTYNDTEEMSVLLSQINVDVAIVRPTFPQLAELIERRHQIAHRADIKNNAPEPILPDQVEQWASVVSKFVEEIIENIARTI